MVQPQVIPKFSLNASECTLRKPMPMPIPIPIPMPMPMPMPMPTPMPTPMPMNSADTPTCARRHVARGAVFPLGLDHQHDGFPIDHPMDVSQLFVVGVCFQLDLALVVHEQPRLDWLEPHLRALRNLRAEVKHGPVLVRHETPHYHLPGACSFDVHTEPVGVWRSLVHCWLFVNKAKAKQRKGKEMKWSCGLSSSTTRVAHACMRSDAC